MGYKTLTQSVSRLRVIHNLDVLSGPGAIPLIPSLPHFSTFSISFIIFYFFLLLLVLSILFVIPLFPFYQNSPTPFPGQMS